MGGGGGGGVCCGHGDPVVDMYLPGSCHRRAAVPGCCCWKRMLETTPRVVVAGDSGVPAQLRRGRRKRGNVCAVFIVCFEGCRCWERFGLWDVVTGRGHAVSKAGPAPNPVPTCKTARQLPSPWAVTTPHAGALMQAVAQPHCGSPAQPRPTGPHRAPTHKFSPKFSGFLLFSSFLHIEQRKQTTFPELFSCRLGGPPRFLSGRRAPVAHDHADALFERNGERTPANNLGCGCSPLMSHGSGRND